MEQSLLGRLPAELRIRIYELALLRPEPSPSIDCRTCSLLRTCKALHADYSSVFYATIVSNLETSHAAPQLLRYLNTQTTSPANLLLVRHLQLSIGELFLSKTDASDVIKNLSKIVRCYKAQRALILQCDLSIVCTAKYNLKTEPLRPEVNLLSRERLFESIANCLEMAGLAVEVSQENMSKRQPDPGSNMWLIHLKHSDLKPHLLGRIECC